MRFQPGPTQTDLCSHRRWLEAGIFGLRKYRNCSAVTAKLICGFVSAQAKIRFYQDAAHVVNRFLILVIGGYSSYNLSRVMRKPTMWFPNRSGKNQAVQSQSQKQARSLKLRRESVLSMYYPCSESKGAAQLRGDREADLRLFLFFFFFFFFFFFCCCCFFFGFLMRRLNHEHVNTNQTTSLNLRLHMIICI